MVEEIKKEEAKPEVKKEEKAKKKEKLLTDLLFHMKPTKILLFLLQDKQWHASSLARETVQSYVYATKTIHLFERTGLVVSSPKGKKRIIKLTEKGEKIAKALNEVLQNAPAGI